MSSELLNSDLTNAKGMDEFIKALKATNLADLEGEEMEQVLERVGTLAAEHDSKGKKAIVLVAANTKARWIEMTGEVAAKARANKEAQRKHQSKASWRKLFSDIDAYHKKLRPLDTQAQKLLLEIEKHWGVRITNYYMKLAPSTLSHMAAIAANADHAVAVGYLNAEVMARKEKKANGAKGNISSGHGVTPGDARSAKAKVLAEAPVPALSADLLSKHKMRVSKTTGLLKPAEEHESDDEVDFSEDGGEESDSGSGVVDEERIEGGSQQAQNGNADNEEEKGEDGMAQTEADLSTCTNAACDEKDQEGVKNQTYAGSSPDISAACDEKNGSECVEDEGNSGKKDEVKDGQVEHNNEENNKAADKVDGGEDDSEKTKSGPSTCKGVKRQLEEQDDAQQAEKRVCLSIDNAAQENAQQGEERVSLPVENGESGKEVA